MSELQPTVLRCPDDGTSSQQLSIHKDTVTPLDRQRHSQPHTHQHSTVKPGTAVKTGWTPVIQATPPAATLAQIKDSDPILPPARFHGSKPPLIQRMLPHTAPPLPGRTRWRNTGLNQYHHLPLDAGGGGGAPPLSLFTWISRKHPKGEEQPLGFHGDQPPQLVCQLV